MYGIPGNAVQVLSGFMEKEEMDRQVKPTTRLLHMHTPERRVKVKKLISKSAEFHCLRYQRKIYEYSVLAS